ncbi:inositol monophosphatase family protein [Pontixanthobacter sp.]|uniref:inositol monophosphatase family protein n=1 Tax=Pontixanthobacter sp. TaxID=2792078 RepID=UPI003C7AE288
MNALDRHVLQLMQDVAARAIMPRYRNLADGDVVEKAKDDLVTIADREAEAMLSEGLSKIDSTAAIVGEEAAHADPSIMDRLSDLCWIIDPIDGTSNFASGTGHFAIMIALADQGITQAGWIYDPRRQRLCHAHRGAGAFIDGEHIIARPSGNVPPSLAAMTRYMRTDQRALFEAEIAPHYTLVAAPGCAAEQYPLTVLGEHDLAIYERTLPWDHAAGCLFVNESGGVCLRPDGSQYRVDSGRKGMIGSATVSLFEELAARLTATGYMPAA